MIIPDEDELVKPFLYSEPQYEGQLSDLSEKLSPMLPLHFDKSYLPSQICEKDYIKLVECSFFFSGKEENLCSYEISKFEACRRKRDIQILHGIRSWQHQHIEKLDKSNQQMYAQGLTYKLNRLKDQYDRLPSTASKQFQMLELTSQIQQLKWRLQYIHKMI